MYRWSFYNQFRYFFILLFFLHSVFSGPLYAQTVSPSGVGTVLNLPAPGAMVIQSPVFVPPTLQGIKVYLDRPFQFDFIVDTGHAELEDDELKAETKKLIKYFLAALTVPEDDIWVNLSPFEQDRMIPEAFAQTEMGRDLLAQDYLLKQLTASLMYPEGEVGKKFWERVRKKADAEYGTTEIPMDTFHKVWITPSQATVYQNGTTAFVKEAYLKVMLEEDYVAMEKNKKGFGSWVRGSEPKAHNSKPTTHIESEIIRELILPEIEKEVNQGENFAQLRQIFHSIILAMWFKESLKKSILGQIYVDQNKTKGLVHRDKDIQNQIYQQYIEAYKKGVYHYIKEDYDFKSQQIIPRKYSSGGIDIPEDFAMIGKPIIDALPQLAFSDRYAKITMVGLVEGPAPDLAMMGDVNSDSERQRDVGIPTSDKIILSLSEAQAQVDRFFRESWYEIEEWITILNQDHEERLKRVLAGFLIELSRLGSEDKVVFVPGWNLGRNRIVRGERVEVSQMDDLQIENLLSVFRRRSKLFERSRRPLMPKAAIKATEDFFTTELGEEFKDYLNEDLRNRGEFDTYVAGLSMLIDQSETDESGQFRLEIQERTYSISEIVSPAGYLHHMSRAWIEGFFDFLFLMKKEVKVNLFTPAIREAARRQTSAFFLTGEGQQFLSELIDLYEEDAIRKEVVRLIVELDQLSWWNEVEGSEVQKVEMVSQSMEDVYIEDLNAYQLRVFLDVIRSRLAKIHRARTMRSPPRMRARTSPAPNQRRNQRKRKRKRRVERHILSDSIKRGTRKGPWLDDYVKSLGGWDAAGPNHSMRKLESFLKERGLLLSYGDDDMAMLTGTSTPGETLGGIALKSDVKIEGEGSPLNFPVFDLSCLEENDDHNCDADLITQYRQFIESFAGFDDIQVVTIEKVSLEELSEFLGVAQAQQPNNPSNSPQENSSEKFATRKRKTG